MKISIKSMKGEVFPIEIDEKEKVAALKQCIQTAKEGYAAERQKLIHKAKILKDDQIIDELGIQPDDFIVCMLSKEIKKDVKKPEPTSTPQATATTESSSVTATPSTTAPVPPTTTTTTPATSVAAVNPPNAPQAQPNPTATVSEEMVNNLVNMGFPQTEVRAALVAAQGNPDLAVEFLMTGIPAGLSSPQQLAQRAAVTESTPSVTPSVTIDSLRLHPQFNMLKRLIQANPTDAVPQVLELIGQQDPALLAEIHKNQDAFLAMMNEPVVENPTQSAPAASAAMQSQPNPSMPGMGGMGGMGGQGVDYARMMQSIGSLPPEQRAGLAASMGMTPEQLEQFIQMIPHLPPGTLEQMTQGRGAGGMDAASAQQNVIHLSQPEMDAVNRIMQLGFSQQEAAQAYIASDKNEEMAANLLLEGGFGDDEGNDDGNDDMYN